MKALTVYQPWASLIVAGAKPFEFRKWNFVERYPKMLGQRIVIHASAKLMDADEALAILVALRCGGARAAETCLRETAIAMLEPLFAGETWGERKMAWEERDNLFPRAVGLGTAVLGQPRNGIEIAEEFGLEHVNDSDREEHANWGWPMLEIEKWDEPVPMKGHQGFWNWPGPAAFGL